MTAPEMQAQDETRARPDALGVGRGLAIICVIYGHALAPWVIQASERFSEPAFLQWKLGASFLMLFFFFVSGVAWRESASLKMTLRQTLALIFIAWSTSVVLEAVRLGFTWLHVSDFFAQDPSTLWQFIKQSARTAIFGDHYTMATMWFLTALGLVRLFAAVLVRWGRVITIVATLALILLGLVSVGAGWRNFYQVSVLGAGLAAFLGGRAARPLFHLMERKANAALAALAIGGLALFGTFALNQGCTFDYSTRCGLPWVSGEFSVTLSYGVYGYLPLFAFTAAAGIAFMTAFAVLVSRYGGVPARHLAVWGRNSVALLVVNGAFLEWAHPQVLRWIAPHFMADNLLFFLSLFAITLAANLAVAALLHRPLKTWFAAALKLAAFAVDLPQRGAALSAARSPRVSQVGE